MKNTRKTLVALALAIITTSSTAGAGILHEGWKKLKDAYDAKEAIALAKQDIEQFTDSLSGWDLIGRTSEGALLQFSFFLMWAMMSFAFWRSRQTKAREAISKMQVAFQEGDVEKAKKEGKWPLKQLKAKDRKAIETLISQGEADAARTRLKNEWEKLDAGKPIGKLLMAFLASLPLGMGFGFAYNSVTYRETAEKLWLPLVATFLTASLLAGLGTLRLWYHARKLGVAPYFRRTLDIPDEPPTSADSNPEQTQVLPDGSVGVPMPSVDAYGNPVPAAMPDVVQAQTPPQRPPPPVYTGPKCGNCGWELRRPPYTFCPGCRTQLAEEEPLPLESALETLDRVNIALYR